MPESASECTPSASIDDEPEKAQAMNFVSAMPRLAAKAATIALVPPDALMSSILGWRHDRHAERHAPHDRHAGRRIDGPRHPHRAARAGRHRDGGIRVTNRSAARAAELAGAPDVTAYATETKADANRLAVDGAEIVLVAVKPAMVPRPAREIGALPHARGGRRERGGRRDRSRRSSRCCPSRSRSCGRCRTRPPIVRQGRHRHQRRAPAPEPDDLALVRTLFETVGEVVEVPESQLDALSTISGSGPAYVFFLIEALTEAADRKGFTPEQAATLVNGTFLGAAELLVSSGEDPAELRRRVTSPGGTTERAIAVLADADLRALRPRHRRRPRPRPRTRRLLTPLAPPPPHAPHHRVHEDLTL